MRKFFQRLISPFKKAWVWYLILLLVLSALVWFVGPLVYLTSAGWRLFIILIFVIAWALNALRLQRKKLKAELQPQSGDHLPALIDENLLAKALADLQGKYKKALHTVAQRNPWTLFITFKRHRLPWYLVIGNPASGKTTMLTDSGLHFPLGNDALIDMKDKAEVLVQWRFAKDAVFIDTDGSLTTFTDKESLAGRVWQELLDLMAWHKIRKSLNGIILTVSLQELLAQTAEQRRQGAHLIRTRLSEIEEELGVKYPVYVQVTKTDILAGFKDFFEHLTSVEREQIWGMTFPDRADQDVVQLFPQEFDTLIARLNDYLLPNLQESRNTTKAALMTMFASQLASCKSPLQSFLNQVFETNHYQEKGYLRGVFFISCRQDTKSINRLFLAEAKTFGLQQGNIAIEDITNKTYFVQNIFRQIILQETHLMQMSSHQARKMNLHRKTVYIVVGALSLVMIYIWANSMVQNQRKLKQLNVTAQDYLQNYQAYYSGNSEIPPSLSELYLMRHTFDEATDPGSVHWGLYQGNRFADTINAIYLKQLQRQFVPFLQATIEDELRKNNSNPSAAYNFLRTYLMLADPAHMNPDFIKSWMKIYWQQTLSSQPVLEATLNENLAEFVSLNKSTGITPNKNLIDSVRVVLRNTSPAQRVYFELENDAAAQQVPISNQFDSDFSQIFGQSGLDKSIPYLYTKDGYENIYKKDLTTLIEGSSDSNWILGSEDKRSLTPDELASIKRYVEAMYMQNYIQAWSGVLSQFKVERFDSLQEAVNVLTLLSQPTSPLKQILDKVYANTVLEKGDDNPNAIAKRKGSALKAPTTVSGAKSLVSTSTLSRAATSLLTGSSSNDQTTAVGAAFFDLNTIVRSSREQPKPGAAGQAGGEGQSTSPYGDIQTALTNLNTYAENIANAANPNKAAFEAAAAHLSGKGDDPISALIQLANRSPEPLNQWLNAVAVNTWAAVLGQAKAYVNQAWQENVWPAYQQMLQYRYPLNRDSQNDASLNDFTTFFAPGGIYDSFFQQYLQPFVNTDGNRLAMLNVDGGSLPISAANVAQLQLIYYIQQAYFSNSKVVSVPFSIRPTDLSQSAGTATLSIAGQSISYSHGPLQTTDVIWPGANPTQMASITIYSLTGAQQSINTSGDWAWLRLLDQSQLKYTFSGSILQARFDINGSSVSYNLEVKSKFNALDVNKIHNLRLPATL